MNEDIVERVAIALYLDAGMGSRRAEGWAWLPERARPIYRRKALVALEAAGYFGGKS